MEKRESSSLRLAIVHDVDATRIKETLPEGIVSEFFGESARPDEVTFCHPHIGSEDLRRNSALVAHFFASARTAFSQAPPLIQVTLLASQYERW